MKRIVLSIVMFLIGVNFLNCSPKKAPVETPVSPPQLLQATQKQAWELEWEKTMAEARKEGTVVIHTATGVSPSLRDEMTRVLKAKYSINLDMIVGRARELAEKIIREHRAGLYLADLYMGGSGTLITNIKPAGVLEEIEPMLLLPEVKDPKAWWEEKTSFVDREKKFIIAFAAAPSGVLAYNANYVSAEKDLQSYRDLLNPKWKGKLVMNDPTVGGSGDTVFYVVLKIMGMEFLKELARQELVFSRDFMQMLQWLARGKYPIVIALGGKVVEWQKEGIPIYEHTPREGSYLSASSGNIALYKKAPHPNASRLFINWLLSKEGQIMFSKERDLQSARIDIPTDFLTPTGVRQPGINYFDTRTEEVKLQIDQYVPLAREIFNIK